MSMEIKHGDRRPITEIYPHEVCGCGRKVRYISPDRDGPPGSCNKYPRCPSWDELKQVNTKLRDAAYASLSAWKMMMQYTPTPAIQQRIDELTEALNIPKDQEP